MKCLICKQGETQPNMTAVTLERGGMTLVVKAAPARICENCGEEYIDEEIAIRLLQQAKEVVQLGVRVAVQKMRAHLDLNDVHQLSTFPRPLVAPISKPYAGEI